MVQGKIDHKKQQIRTHFLIVKAIILFGILTGIVLFSRCRGTKHSKPSDEFLQGVVFNVEEECNSIYEEGEVSEARATVDITQEKEEDTNKGNKVVKCEILDTEQEDMIYEAIVDVRPTFPGGDEKLMEWLSQHIQYPQNAYDSHIQGRVIVRFLVKEDGSVGDAKIVKSIFPLLDEEALRVVTTLPKFNPAILDGKAFEYWFTIPITFRLEDDLKDHEIKGSSAIIATNSKNNDDISTNPEESKIYKAVEQMPEYPGGQGALLKFIGDNLKYPEEMSGCFQGSVIVQYYVDTLGHVCDPQIVRGLDSTLDKEVLRVIRLFPDFIPGQHKGKKVNVYMKLPISFDPNRYGLLHEKKH